MTGHAPIRLEAAGYMARSSREYLDRVRQTLEQAGLAGEFTYRGEIDRAGKLAFLAGLDVLSVPATYDEPKGLFLLEAMASGVPVVQPRRGAFVEIVEKTGGGLLVEPDDAQQLADGLYALWSDRTRQAAACRSRVSRRARALHHRPVGRPAACRVRSGGLTVLDVSGVSKHYPTPRGPLTVLSNVSLSMAPGDAAAITGPSGSGKSTLLYVLGALEPPSEGTVTLGGRNPFALSARDLADFRNAEIGFVFQDHCLLPQCSVLENVLIPTLVDKTGSTNGNDETARAQALIEQVGLAGRIDHRPGELSGGEKQRVAIARALIRQPRLLLCDEPTGNLDQASASIVAELLLSLHRRLNNILIVVTHSAKLASDFPIRYELADRGVTRV